MREKEDFQKIVFLLFLSSPMSLPLCGGRRRKKGEEERGCDETIKISDPLPRAAGFSSSVDCRLRKERPPPLVSGLFKLARKPGRRETCPPPFLPHFLTRRYSNSSRLYFSWDDISGAKRSEPFLPFVATDGGGGRQLNKRRPSSSLPRLWIWLGCALVVWYGGDPSPPPFVRAC